MNGGTTFISVRSWRNCASSAANFCGLTCAWLVRRCLLVSPCFCLANKPSDSVSGDCGFWEFGRRLYLTSVVWLFWLFVVALHANAAGFTGQEKRVWF